MIWYLIGGLIGIIFFKKRYHLSTWSAIGYGISLTLCVYFGIGAISGFIASSAGVDDLVSPWVYGLLFLAFLAGFIANIKRLRKSDSLGDTAEVSKPAVIENLPDSRIQEGRKYKKCPYCAEYILEDAVYCRWCKHTLTDQEPQIVIDKMIHNEGPDQEVKTHKPWGFGNWFLLLLGIAALGVLSFLVYYGIKDQIANSGSSNPTKVVSLSSGTSTPKPTSSPILYSMNFTKNDGQWLELNSGTQKIEMVKGYYQISSNDISSCLGSTTEINFSNGILAIDLISITDTTNGSSYSIMWRYDDVENYYGLFLTGSGEVAIYKLLDNEMTDLFISNGAVVDTQKSIIPVHISFDGPYMEVFIDGTKITSLYDSSISDGGVGLALCSVDAENGATAVFDNLVVYSTSESSSVLPKESESKPTEVTTYQESSEGKILVTVINSAPVSQEVYCEGIFIFNINPGETKTFRFQKGRWRIDLCYPGTFPCDNFSYVDMTSDTLTYTIGY